MCEWLCCPCMWASRLLLLLQIVFWIYTLAHIHNDCECDGVPCY